MMDAGRKYQTFLKTVSNLGTDTVGVEAIETELAINEDLNTENIHLFLLSLGLHLFALQVLGICLHRSK